MVFVGESTQIKAEDVELPLEKLVLKLEDPQKLTLDLSDHTDYDNAANSGLYITVSVEGFNEGRVNEKPFPNQKKAEREYDRILGEVKRGNYILEYDGQLRLRLTDQ